MRINFIFIDPIRHNTLYLTLPLNLFRNSINGGRVEEKKSELRKVIRSLGEY